MAKKLQPLHWFPFPTDRWLGELAGGLRADQAGALSFLLATAYTQNPPCTLPDDDVYLAGISRLGGKWKANRAAILATFTPTDGGRLLCGWLREIYDEQFVKYTNRSTANRDNRRGGNRDAKDSTNGDTIRGTNGGQEVKEKALPLAPYSAKGEEPASDDARAPVGAALPTPPTGITNTRISASAAAALLKTGVRQEQIEAQAKEVIPPLEAEAQRRERERGYAAVLARSVDAWRDTHRADAVEVMREERRGMGFPSTGELTPSKSAALRTCIEERVREELGWPTLEQWDGSATAFAMPAEVSA